MKKSIVFLLLIFCANALAFDTNQPKSILLTPQAPKFSDVERQTELAARRAKVSEKLGKNSMLILFATEPRIYTNDVDYLYRQENNLFYLTGLAQRNATLVLYNNGAKTGEVLFLPKRDPRRETWTGKMYSNDEATSIAGVKTIVDESELKGFLQSLKDKKPFKSKNEIEIPNSIDSLFLMLPTSSFDQDFLREYPKEFEFAKGFANVTIDDKSKDYKYDSTVGYAVKTAEPIFADLRLIKSPMELKLLQHAIDITTEAQMMAMATSQNVRMEYETQAEIEYVFRKRNADYWGYPSIVGCGLNATTLHYEESQGEVKSGDLLLMDVGAEYEHYTADVTRTFPVNGKFSKEQAEIYQVVYDAQEAAARKLKPNATFFDASEAATNTVEAGLAKLGLITAVGAVVPGTEREFTDDKGNKRKIGTPQYRLWFMHGWGHWLGMNVHDVGDYSRKLQAGMVMTNEPGIYIRQDALDHLPKTPETAAFIAKIKPVFEKYKNIGVRIEDDMVITNNGVEWMTKALPRSITDIESFMQSASKQPK
jgi:Xaa-Pro aminopeptidase